MTGKYDDLNKTQLIELLEKQDRTKKLGLVWERDEIDADKALDHDFIVAQIDGDLSDKPAPWDNLVIESDNYDALRWLRMTHRGRVKCIYIDPPYNTGNKDWVYNDRYMSADDRFRQSTWLEFLYRRLTLARDLLAEDGVILISINDDQRALLELMADEALPGMRLGSMAWRTRQGSNADHQAFMSADHEHILVFGKDGFRFSGNEKSYSMYKNFDAEKDDWFRLSDLTLGFSHTERPNLFYPLHDEQNDIWYPPNPNRVWVYPSKEISASSRTRFMQEWIEADHIRFPEEPTVKVFKTREELVAACEAKEVPYSGRSPMITPDLPHFDFWVGKRIGFGTPSFKRYKKDLRNTKQPLSTWISPKAEAAEVDDGSNTLVVGTNDEGAKEIKSVFGAKAFNYAKPVSLIRELVRQATQPGDIVLDFFAGSATTAQAVMELNGEENDDRRFIMVSSTEATEDDPDKNICRDVTAERVRRLNASDDKKYADLAAGFAYLRTKQIDFEDLDYDLNPSDAWTCLEAFHGLPLTPYDPDQPWNVHEGDGAILVLVDQFDLSLIEWLRPRTLQNVHVYAWAPGQITQHLDGMHIDVSPVRETLVKAFRA
jgi:adenine-specific DNA-methyltransferase